MDMEDARLSCYCGLPTAAAAASALLCSLGLVSRRSCQPLPALKIREGEEDMEERLLSMAIAAIHPLASASAREASSNSKPR